MASSGSFTSLFRFSDELLSRPTGTVIFSEGEAGDAMYVVKEGEVDIVVHGKVVETVGPGGIVGEMALIDPSPRSATVVARTPCTLVKITPAHFQFLVQQTPFFAIEVMRMLVRRLRHMDTIV
ncbi:MAG TPA: cyclic nucleotide-binding domain-containing protein [Candidatus Kryptonia bacterium]|nr:cyclic nucleotide-binding domain-containing protein [Candidatus Kryptonia bacterium]